MEFGYYLTHGEMMPDKALDTLGGFDAIFLGAIGHPDIQDHITLNGLLLPIRRRFERYVCLCPSVLYPGVQSPLADKKPYDIDLIVVRENTEGEYANIGGFAYEGQPGEVAIQTSVFTRRGCERVIRYAFELARQRDAKKHVASVTKSNALGYMTLWDRTFDAVARRVSRHRNTFTADRCRLHGVHQTAGDVRRGRGVKLVRGHSHRHRGDDQWEPRARRQREPESRPVGPRDDVASPGRNCRRRLGAGGRTPTARGGRRHHT